MGRVGGAQGRGELQRILLDQRQAQHDEVERDGHRKLHRLGTGTGTAGHDAVPPQRLLDGLGAEVPVIDHQCSRSSDRWGCHALVGQAERTGGLAARAPFVEQPLEPDQTSHPGHQRLVLDRFGQEVIGARLQSPQPFGGFAKCGDHDHGNVQRRGVVLQPAATLEAVHSRHHDVEQDEIRLPIVRHAAAPRTHPWHWRPESTRPKAWLPAGGCSPAHRRQSGSWRSSLAGSPSLRACGVNGH